MCLFVCCCCCCRCFVVVVVLFFLFVVFFFFLGGGLFCWGFFPVCLFLFVVGWLVLYVSYLDDLADGLACMLLLAYLPPRSFVRLFAYLLGRFTC